MTKPICEIMMGLPATGKSTLVEAMLDVNPEAFVYSTDVYIEECAAQNKLTYNEVFEEFIAPATKNMNERAEVAIKSRQDIIWDQTNLSVKKRSKIINRMRQAGYQVRCICIMPPEPSHISDQKDWKYRLNNRPGKNIPENILTNMVNSYTLPTIEEGFDMITFYNMHGALLAIDNGEE